MHDDGTTMAWDDGAIEDAEAAAVSIQGLNFGLCDGPEAGWGTWIRTRTDGVRVRCSTVKLFPRRPAARSIVRAVPVDAR